MQIPRLKVGDTPELGRCVGIIGNGRATVGDAPIGPRLCSPRGATWQLDTRSRDVRGILARYLVSAGVGVQKSEVIPHWPHTSQHALRGHGFRFAQSLTDVFDGWVVPGTYSSPLVS